MMRFEGKTARPSHFITETPMEHSVAIAERVKRGKPIDFLLLNAGLVLFEKRVLTAAAVKTAQAPLSSHHQLTDGLLHSANN